MDQRKYLRADTNFKVWCQTFDREEVSYGRLLARNISINGIQLNILRLEDIGTQLLLQFKMPYEEDKIIARGKIVWSDKKNTDHYEIGIEFTDISDKDIKSINRFVMIHGESGLEWNEENL